MQNWVVRLRHVQNNLFISDCQHFHNEKTLQKLQKLHCISFFGNQNWEMYIIR